MHLRNRDLPPALVIAAIMVMAEVARRWAEWLDESLLQRLDALARVGRAAITSGDRQCPAAFVSLHQEHIFAVEQALARQIREHVEAVEGARAPIFAAMSEFGWTRESLERMAGHADQSAEGGTMTGPAAALEDEAHFFERLAREKDRDDCSAAGSEEPGKP